MTVNPYPPFITTVVRSARPSPGFVRITVGGDALRHFGTHGLDQRIKLIFQNPGGGYGDFGILDTPAPTLGEWAMRWRQLSDGERNPVRTFTPSALRPERGEIDIDFAVHHPAGTACSWALAATAGDQLIVVGPDGRSAESTGGIDFNPGPAGRLLLVADETGFPALRNIMAQLPPGVVADVFAEAAAPADLEVLGRIPARVRLRALLRAGRAGERTVAAVRQWSASAAGAAALAAAPADGQGAGTGFYAWLVGESATVKTLRRHLVTDLGLAAAQVQFSGYWKLGQAEN